MGAVRRRAVNLARGTQPLYTVSEIGERDVGRVDLIRETAEILADGAEVNAAGDGVLQESGGVRPVGMARERAWRRTGLLGRE